MRDLTVRCVDCRRSIDDPEVTAIWVHARTGAMLCQACHAKVLEFENSVPESWL